MPKTSQTMVLRMPAPPGNQLLSSSQFSEAISIVSPSELPAACPHARAGNNTSRQSHTTSANESAHAHADENQSQSHSQSNTPSSSPSSPTQPIYITPRQPRKRDVERLAPLAFFEIPKRRVEPAWLRPQPGQVHHRADQVKNYHLMGTSGWEGFQQRRLAIAQAEIGVIDTAWAATGGGVIRDFGVKKRRGKRQVVVVAVVPLSTIREEGEESEKEAAGAGAGAGGGQ